METGTDELKPIFRARTPLETSVTAGNMPGDFSVTYANQRSASFVSVLAVSLNNPGVSEPWADQPSGI